MSSNHPDDAGEQPESSSVNQVPHPDIDITQTKQWVSVRDPAMIDVGTAVTHNNIEVLAALDQTIMRILLEQAKEIRKLDADMRIVKAGIRAILKALGDDSASELSSRSSMNSRRADGDSD